MTLAEQKRQAILIAIEAHGGNVVHAARELGITPRTINRYMAIDAGLREAVEASRACAASENK